MFLTSQACDGTDGHSYYANANAFNIIYEIRARSVPVRDWLHRVREITDIVAGEESFSGRGD